MLKAERKPNRLIKEKSPYLLKHAYNPVEWYPWGEEAIRKARNDSKPILLSIGYSSCHWCNVMEKESFENDEIASIINENFIPIKVDREERPEIDKLYMAAVQAMTGSGGWPLTVFLTPDLKPFFGGTYFPPEPRYGMPGFKQVLLHISRLWKEKKEEILESSSKIMEAVSQAYLSEGTELPRKEVIDEAFESLASSYDDVYGGFALAPKFPLPCSLNFLLQYSYRKGNQLALSIVRNTLLRMCLGGIRDHVGGGFHRYSTDRFWLVPHFEKMLYDNALISNTLLNAFRVAGENIFLDAATETLTWIINEMMDEEGGFYSAQDADTTEGEGHYYTWTPEELRAVLGSRAELFCKIYGITKEGNFEGRSIPNLVYSSQENISISTKAEIKEMKMEIYSARKKRERPLTDTKILTSWNGLVLSALSNAYRLTGMEEYIKAAEKTVSFIMRRMWDGERLKRVYREGIATLPGTVEDYSFLVQGLIDLFECTQNEMYLREAIEVSDAMFARLWDEKGGLYFEEEGIEGIRLKESYDGPTPSGNSVAAMNMVRLSEITVRQEFKERASKIFSAFSKKIESDPAGHAWMLCAYDLYINGMYEIVITSEKTTEARPFIERINKIYLPDAVVIVADRSNFDSLKKLTSLLESREPGKRALAYVCRNNSCLLPTDDPEKLVEIVTKRN